jgi:pimeloyl-ACP methyl ester carboxylesterase
METPPSLFTLPNGRTLSWGEYGDPRGFPVVYFADLGSTRLEAALFHEQAKECGLRLLALDRPGLGRSDFLPLSNHDDIVPVLKPLLSHLQIARFAVMARGAGAGFAAAVAHRMPTQVTAVSLISPRTFNHTQGNRMVRALRSLCRTLFRMGISLRDTSRRSLSKRLRRLSDECSAADRKILQQPRIVDVLLTDAAEGVLNGKQGLKQDLKLAWRDWLGQIDALTVPVRLWQTSEEGGAAFARSCLMGKVEDLKVSQLGSRGSYYFVRQAGNIMLGLFRTIKCTQSVSGIAALSMAGNTMAGRPRLPESGTAATNASPGTKMRLGSGQ